MDGHERGRRIKRRVAMCEVSVGIRSVLRIPVLDTAWSTQVGRERHYKYTEKDLVDMNFFQLKTSNIISISTSFKPS